MLCSTSGSRVRGITPSITMYAGATRPPLAARRDDVLGLLVEPRVEPVQLDEEGRRRIAGVAGAERVLHGLDGDLVDHLQRRRREPAGGDRRHRARRLVEL